MKWYEVDKKRVVQECILVKTKYPTFTICKVKDNLSWEGLVNVIPEGLTEPPLKVQVICPEGYPASPPNVYPVSPEIPEGMWGHKWHRWHDGKLCYIKPINWQVVSG